MTRKITAADRGSYAYGGTDYSAKEVAAAKALRKYHKPEFRLTATNWMPYLAMARVALEAAASVEDLVP